MSQNKNVFIERFEIQRVKLGMSQSEFADKLGMSHSSYKRLIAGETSTKPYDVAIRFYNLTGTSIFGYNTNISKQHQILSKLSGLPDNDLDFINYVIDYLLQHRI